MTSIKKIVDWCNDTWPRCGIDLCAIAAVYNCRDEFNIQVFLCEEHYQEWKWKRLHSVISDKDYLRLYEYVKRGKLD